MRVCEELPDGKQRGRRMPNKKKRKKKGKEDIIKGEWRRVTTPIQTILEIATRWRVACSLAVCAVELKEGEGQDLVEDR